MISLYQDTDITIRSMSLVKNPGDGSYSETESGFPITTKGKFDFTTGNLAIQDKRLSENTVAVLFVNEVDIKENDYVINNNLGKEFKVLAVDRTTLRGNLAHLEVYLGDVKDA